MNGLLLYRSGEKEKYYNISLLFEIRFYIYINNKYLTQIDATDAKISENLRKIEKNKKDFRYVDHVFAI